MADLFFSSPVAIKFGTFIKTGQHRLLLNPHANSCHRTSNRSRSAIRSTLYSDEHARSEAGNVPIASPSEPKPNDSWESLKGILPFDVIQKILKPGQYLGNEFGAVSKPWSSVSVRFCLAYPDLYSIGMSSTGHIVLYSCLNERPRLLCDRAYLPGPDMQKALQEREIPLFAVESKRSLRDFDVIGMSLMYELGATNCVKLMELGGIPYTSKERDTHSSLKDGPPLVFAGGLTVTANPEPYADLFDFMSIGDGEDMLPEIGDMIASALEHNPNITREEMLLKLAQIPGVYVPRFYAPSIDGSVRPIRLDVPIKIAKRNSLPQPWRAVGLVPITDPVHDRLSVEIRRGCTRGCRFCLPGMVQRPARDVEPEGVMQAVREGVKNTGYNEFSLLSLSCSDWLSLPSAGIQLKNELAEEGEAISLSLGSQRVDRFDEDIVNVVGGLRKSGITFAPEAGTQRMRNVINKGLTNEDLARGVKLAYDSGYDNVKLYFMINLPSESDDDVMGIAETIKWLQRICRNKGRRRLSVNVTVSTFTPKCWTPFQWHSTSIEEVKRKQIMLKRALSSSRDVKLSMTDPMLSAMEDFIGRGDRRLGKVIVRAHELGAGMDAWWEGMKDAYDAWCRAIREADLEWKYRRTERGEWNIVDTEAEAIRGPRGWYDVVRHGNLDKKNLLPKGDHQKAYAEFASPLDRPLPWDHIDTGLEKGWLRDELMRALSETLTPDCSFHECSSCGVCGEQFGNNVTIPPREVPPYRGVYAPSTESNQRIRVVFEKTGALSLASHLDFARMLDRLVRRASIPISFTGGYHPHPRIIVATALPFGATASEEYVDFITREEMCVQNFSQRLSALLPSGLKLVTATEIPLKAKQISLRMRSAEYVIAVATESDSTVEWSRVVDSVQIAQSVEVEKVTKRGNKSTRDLRKMLYSIRVALPTEVTPVLHHIGINNWPDGAGVLFCETKLSNEGALGPEGVVDMINLVMNTEGFQMLHAHRLKVNLEPETPA